MIVTSALLLQGGNTISLRHRGFTVNITETHQVGDSGLLCGCEEQGFPYSCLLVTSGQASSPRQRTGISTRMPSSTQSEETYLNIVHLSQLCNHRY